MNAEIINIDERAIELWEAYLQAKSRAEQTQRFRDAKHAGRIWGKFLDLYSRDREPRGAVIPFRKGAR